MFKINIINYLEYPLTKKEWYILSYIRKVKIRWKDSVYAVRKKNTFFHECKKVTMELTLPVFV